MLSSSSNSDRVSELVSSQAIVFVNAQSGRSLSHNLVPGIERVFRSYGLAAEIRETPSSAELESQARQAILRGAHLFFAVGGDGTLQGLVNAAFGYDVVLGVIPVGGGNDFARALGLPREPLSALSAALSGERRSVDLARVCTADGAERLYLGGGGVGLDAESAKYARTRYRNWPGRSRYVASALRGFSVYRSRRLRITLENSEEEQPWRKFVLASVLNTPTFGAGIQLTPSARIDDGLLDFAFLEELRFWQLLRTLPSLAARGILRLPHLRITQIRKLRLETELPAFFQGDGEILGPTPVEIEVVPNAVRFLAPKLASS